ncbi:MAG: TetR family transcriptional regulator [Solirubrobacterales bacterium]|nr:TetR family transcriptional regulator [Solirubrobacterales bacterium]
MPTTTPTRARPRGTARREALLDAVLRLVAEVGVDAVTHRRVAEVAGLPLASTTYWFESKEHLLIAALERAAGEDIERLRAFLGETAAQAGDPIGQAGDPVGLAVAAILGLGDGQSSRGWLLATYALMLEAARMPALRDVTMRWTDAYLEAIPPLLAAAGSRHPRSDAELLLAAADGLLVEQLATGDASDLAPRLRRLADALVKA